MWRKTINTIRKNPKMLWGFTIPVIVNLILTFPYYRSFVLTLLGNYSRIDYVPNFGKLSRAFAVASPFVYILVGVFVLTPVYGYVYKAVTGNEIKLWTRNWFLKYSWRVVAKSLIDFLILFAVFILLFLLLALPELGFAMYTIAFSAWVVLWIISMTSVTVEDRFADSLPNAFFVGRRYYLKIYAATIAVMIPAIVICGWYMIYLHKTGMDIAYAVPVINLPPKLAVFIFLFIAFLLSIYYVFAQAFLFTYSMHHYIKERTKMEEEDAAREQTSEETDAA